jgi:hypothetical protein
MRHRLFLISIIALADGRSAAAQIHGLAEGDRVRITTEADSLRFEGRFAGLRDDVLFLKRDGDTLRFQLGSVRLLERGIRRSFDRKEGLKGAVIGAAAGAAFAVYGLGECALGEAGVGGGCHGQSAGESVLFVTALTGGGALLGGALGGGGSNAKRGGLAGILVGSAVGAMIGLAAYESPDCTPESFMCLDFGPGMSALAGGVLGGVALGSAGVIVGALARDTEWMPIAGTDLAFGVVPAPGGVQLAGSFTF